VIFPNGFLAGKLMIHGKCKILIEINELVGVVLKIPIIVIIGSKIYSVAPVALDTNIFK
jgi:hypothetical protein